MKYNYKNLFKINLKMRKKLNSSSHYNSGVKFTRLGKPLIDTIDEKFLPHSNLFNNSNDSIINNSNNDFIDDIDDINEENIYENLIGENILSTPINDTHILFSNKLRFGNTLTNMPLKKIIIPKSKSPNFKHIGPNKKRNELKTQLYNVKKNLTSRNEIFLVNNDFLHCRNCMTIIATGRYGKFYFNK